MTVPAEVPNPVPVPQGEVNGITPVPDVGAFRIQAPETALAPPEIVDGDGADLTPRELGIPQSVVRFGSRTALRASGDIVPGQHRVPKGHILNRAE